MAIMNLGEIVYHGSPQSAIDELRSKVFHKIVSRDELQNYANEYKIISNKMVGGKPLIHVFSDEHPQKDVFFSKINTSNVLV